MIWLYVNEKARFVLFVIFGKKQKQNTTTFTLRTHTKLSTMITSLKSKINTISKDNRIHGIADKNIQRFKYCLLGLCTCLYISVFAASSDMPKGDMNIENKNIRPTDYFDHVPVVNGSAYGAFIGKDEDVVVVPIGE